MSQSRTFFNLICELLIRVRVNVYVYTILQAEPQAKENERSPNHLVQTSQKGISPPPLEWEYNGNSHDPNKPGKHKICYC